MTYPQNTYLLLNLPTYLLHTNTYPIYYILPRLRAYYLLPSLPNKLITYPTFNKLIA
jgi:hypothetical protein